MVPSSSPFFLFPCKLEPFSSQSLPSYMLSFCVLNGGMISKSSSPPSKLSNDVLFKGFEPRQPSFSSSSSSLKLQKVSNGVFLFKSWFLISFGTFWLYMQEFSWRLVRDWFSRVFLGYFGGFCRLELEDHCGVIFVDLLAKASEYLANMVILFNVNDLIGFHTNSCL